MQMEEQVISAELNMRFDRPSKDIMNVLAPIDQSHATGMGLPPGMEKQIWRHWIYATSL